MDGSMQCGICNEISFTINLRLKQTSRPINTRMQNLEKHIQKMCVLHDSHF